MIGVDEALEMYWSLFDPAGIAQRQEDNRLFDEEMIEVEVNFLDHLFVFDRRQFLQEVHSAPDEIRRVLVNLAVNHPPRQDPRHMLRNEYEDLYFLGSTDAGEWQYNVPDEDDDSSPLLHLLRSLRSFVRQTDSFR